MSLFRGAAFSQCLVFLGSLLALLTSQALLLIGVEPFFESVADIPHLRTQVLLATFLSYFIGLGGLWLCVTSLSKRKQLWSSVSGLYLWSGLGFLLVLPDGLLSFLSAQVSPFVSVSLYLLTAVTLTIVPFFCRLPLLFLLRRTMLQSPNNKSHLLGKLYLAIVPVLELGAMWFLPLSTLGSLPPPFPPGILVSKWIPGDHSPHQRDVPTEPDSGLMTIVYATEWSDSLRKLVAQTLPPSEGQPPEGIWKTVADDFLSQLPEWQPERIRIYFPETVLDVTSFHLSSLASFLESTIRGRMGGVASIELIAGVGNSVNNNLVWATRSSSTGRLEFAKLRSKQDLVPFFERPWFGLEYFPQNGSNYDAGWGQLSRLRDDGLRDPIPQALICYEALYPQNWMGKGSIAVFTNHNVFASLGLASRTYDLKLRTLVTVFRRPGLFVGNGGGSGLILPAWGPLPPYLDEIGSVFVVRGQRHDELGPLLQRSSGLPKD